MLQNNHSVPLQSAHAAFAPTSRAEKPPANFLKALQVLFMIFVFLARSWLSQNILIFWRKVFF
jgi:hypothetical protein